MQTYTVYEPRPAPDSIEQRAASLVFVKDGFSFSAFVFPPLWLALNCRRLLAISIGTDGVSLWTRSIGIATYIVAFFAIGIVAAVAHLPVDTVSWAYFALNAIMGFEARDLLRADLEARGYVLRAIVTGRSLAECERRFLNEWLPDARLDQARQNVELTGGGGTSKRNYKEPVIGMFPAHGG